MGIDTMMSNVLLDRAKRHVYNVCLTGKVISLTKNSTSDTFGGKLTGSSETFHAFPPRFSPQDRIIKDKIGWVDQVDVVLFFSWLEMELKPMTFQSFKAFNSLTIDGKTYNISHIDPYSGFGTSYLYILVGAVSGGKK